MTHDELEKLYAYKGSEKFLSEMDSHKTLYIFIFIYLYFFFTLIFYIVGESLLIERNFINQYLSLNVGEGNTFFSDLKNASLYLFAAQATLIGLIFPIVIAYVGLANTGRASSDKMMNIYKTHTGFNVLASSSFLLLAFYSFLFIVDSYINSFLFKASQFLFLAWFTFNLYLIYIFLSKTIDFIYGSKKIEEIKKYAYNYRDGVKDGFSVLADELNYFLENKSVSRAQELEIDLVEFIRINYIKHKFSKENMNFFLGEIRKIVDNALDYNNSHSIKKILYIYYYLGGRLSKIEQGLFLEEILEMNYVALIDLNNKLNISDDFKDYVHSVFLESWDSWNAWNLVLKEDKSKLFYSYYTFLVCSLYISHDKKLDNILDTFLRIPERVKNTFDIEDYKTLKIEKDVCSAVLVNFCTDMKFLIIKKILNNNYNFENKIIHIKSILYNSSLLSGTTAIRADTRITTSKDLLYSLMRISGNPYYSDYLNDIIEKTKIKNRIPNRTYWMDTSSCLNKITETYAYIYDQFITDKVFPSFSVNNYLKKLNISEQVELLHGIDSYIVELEKVEFTYNFFKDKKVFYIKKRYVNLILLLRDHINSSIVNYYSRFNLTTLNKENIFYRDFSLLYKHLSRSLFVDSIIWTDNLNDYKIFRFDYEFDFIDPDLILNIDVINNNGYNPFNDLFLNEVFERANKKNVKSNNFIFDILSFMKDKNFEDYTLMVFDTNFFADMNDRNFNFNIEIRDDNVYLIEGFEFKFVGDYECGFYASVFSKRLIKSVEILSGNKTFEKSEISLIKPQSNSVLLYKIKYDFCYKINLDLDFSLFTFTGN